MAASLRVAAATLLACAVVRSATALAPQEHAPPPPPASLPPHPRLILTDARVATIKQNIATRGDAQSMYAQLLQHADWWVGQPLVPQPAPGPSGILIAVRGCLDGMFTTALAYKLSGNGTYLDRAVAEATNLATWHGWNPGHFLDTGEASVAMGLMYDWLYRDVNASTLSTWSDALLTYGLNQYRTAFVNHTQFWINDNMNWNCVCSSGAFAAVLALYGDAGYPSWAWSDIMQPAMTSAPYCMRNYQPEGSWDESSGYWAYASTYNILAFNMLQSALGSDTGFADLPGVQEGGTFPLKMTGPSGLLFDWADSWPYPTVAYGDNFSTTLGFGQWWGGRFNDSVSAYYFRQSALTQAANSASQGQQQWGAYAYGLMFYSPLGTHADVAALPRCYAYMSRFLGVFRSDWHWPWDGTGQAGPGNALFLKGGDTGLTHQHMDLGSWMWEINGVRFIEDLAADNYNLPDYFGPTRYDYYRLNSWGHNVLSFGGAMMGQSNKAPLVTFNTSGPGCQGQAYKAESSTDSAAAMGGVTSRDATATSSSSVSLPTLDGFAIVNLTHAYPSTVPGLASVLRGWASFQGAGAVLVVDEVQTSAGFNASNLTSTLHTYGTVSIATDGQSATITKGANVATVTILGPAYGTSCPGLTFTSRPVVLPPPQYDSTGLTQVDATTSQPGSGSCTRLALWMAPQGSPVPPVMSINPVGTWQAAGPVA